MVVEHVHNRILSGELAKERSDLDLVLDDLNHVKICAEHLVSIFPQADFIERAILDSALIRYRRCFNTSARTPLVPNFSGQESLLAEKHKYFRDLADKYVAHSVNYFENSGATISVSLNENGENHLGKTIGVSKSTVLMISLDDLRVLFSLTKYWTEKVKTRIEEVDGAFLTQITNKGVQDVLSFPSQLSKINDTTKIRR